MEKYMKVIIIMQAIFLVMAAFALYFLYPKINVDVDGTLVSFNSINANVIIISENPDFSNPRYLDIVEGKNISFDLYPGTYYWKAANNLIEGLSKKFTVKSEVGMKIEEESEKAELVNVGNVKINVTKGEGGVMIGHIILEPNESIEIKNKQDEEYTGRQT